MAKAAGVPPPREDRGEGNKDFAFARTFTIYS